MSHLTPGAPMAPAQSTASGGTAGSDDDIIPTAIVIKNIPFNVKRETLLDIIVSWPSFLCCHRPRLDIDLVPCLVPF
jgi:hypothetical protein